MGRTLEQTTLKDRQRAAWKLVREQEMDGLLAISYIVWPDAADIPRLEDLTYEARVRQAIKSARTCSARHGEARCDNDADELIGLCETHLWAYLSGENFDFWGGE